ncbi:MAG: hypothetical protein WC457_01795 [Patescibacteria group bacterium]
MKSSVKDSAIKLRKKGLSYNIISNKLGIPKGTLSYWFKSLRGSAKITKTNTSKAKEIWAKNITIYNKSRSIRAREKWLEIQKNSRHEMASLSKHDLLFVGTALYWAEGYKKGNWSVIFSNSDPRMHQIMMRYFLEVCRVPLNKIKGQVQTHSNVDKKKAVAYWSKITRVPQRQFMKCNVSVPKSSKKVRGNTLPYGTLRIRINDVNLTNKIKGYILGLIESSTIGV